jgi:hypothetical protein
MSLFIIGIILGCFMGILLITLLIKSKESDEAAYRVIAEAKKIAQERLPANHQLSFSFNETRRSCPRRQVFMHSQN